MILVTRMSALGPTFRRQETYTDADGNEQTRTVRVGTGRKTDDGTVIADEVTLFGDPVVEDSGDANPRIAFSHPWSDEELTWIRDELIPTIATPSPRDATELRESLPDDWQFPTEE